MGWASCTTASDNLQDKTQENALVLFLKGEERIRVGQQAVIAIIVSLFQQALATVAIC
jgi:glutaredoxin-related protein